MKLISRAPDQFGRHGRDKAGHDSNRRVTLLARAAAVALTGLALVLTCSHATSQAGRTIKIVVPFPPGGGIDALARVMADQIGRTHGPVVVVENRPGAGTVIGTEAVFRAKPDGNTLLIGNNSFLVAPHMHKTDYDPVASFAPICAVASTPTVIGVNAQSPYRTLDDLIRAARAKPGELTYASVPGAVLSVGFEMLNRAAGVKLTFVPYTGTAPALSAVLGGHVAATLVDYPVAAGQLQAGTLRALATGSRTRIEWLQEVPTVAESGYPDFDLELWYGMLAPAQTPKDVIAQLADWFAASVRPADIRSKLFAQGIKAGGQCGAEFAALLRKENDEYGRVIREANLKAD